MERFAGWCFRCLNYGHKADECTNQLRCIRCSNFGHRAKNCRASYYGELPSLQSKGIPPGAAAHQRPETIWARVGFSEPMVVSEGDLAGHAVIAAVASGSPAVSRRQVAQTIAVRFQIAEDDVDVSLNSHAGDFLVYFKDTAHRMAALRYPGPPYLWMDNSRSALKITPWTRQSQATGAVVVNLYYKVRLCIEGMPRHAWQEETIRGLFHHPTLIEGIECDSLDFTKDSACLCVWVWTNDPRCFAREVELELEEALEERTDDDEPRHCPELGGFVDQRRRQPRFQPVCLITYKYNVLLHIDRVFDFSPATAASFQPWVHDYNWQLGVKDDDELPP